MQGDSARYREAILVLSSYRLARKPTNSHLMLQPEWYMVRNPSCVALRFSWFSLACCVVLTIGCTGNPSSDGAERGDSASSIPSDPLLLASSKIALPPPGITLADLPDAESPGAQGVGEFCTACHALPSPLMHSATDWPGVIRRMWLRMDRVSESFGIPVPSGAQRLAMVEYLVTNALTVREAGLPAGPGRDRFVETCSRCHQLADPRQHSSEDWVSVVRRMSGHIEEMLGDFLEPTKLEEIVLYLQRASQR